MATYTYSQSFKNGDDKQYYTFTATYTVTETNTNVTLTIDSVKVTRPYEGDGSVNLDAYFWSPTAVGDDYNFSATMSKSAKSRTLTKEQGTPAVFTKTYLAQSENMSVVWAIDNIPAGREYTKNGNFRISIPAKTSYTVTYNANGGSNAPASQTKWYNETLRLDAGTPVRNNYVFKNWNTKADGTGSILQPKGNYTANASATLYAQWYAPYTVTYNANGGSGAPGNQTKIYNSALKLSSTKPTRTGWTFKNWLGSNGVTYTAGGTVAASVNQNLTLTAQWTRAISSVTIGNMKAIRTADASSTTETDGGTYAYITVPYTIKGAAAGNASMTMTATAKSGPVPTVSVVQGSASKYTDTDLSGTFIARASGCDAEVEYTFTAVITCTNTSATQTAVTTTKTVVLTSAFYTMDVKAGGGGIAFGKPATENDIFECAFAAKFNNTLEVRGGGLQLFSQKSLITASAVGSDVPSSGLNYFGSFKRFDKTGENVFYCETSKSTADTIYTSFVTRRVINGTAITNGFYNDIKSDGTCTVSFTGGGKAAWQNGLDILKKTGDTMTGNLIIQKGSPAQLTLKDTNIAYNTAPSGTVYDRVEWQDKNGNAIGHVEFVQNTSKGLGVQIGVRNTNSAGTLTWYQVGMSVSSTGVITYSVPQSDKFREAIGLADSGWIAATYSASFKTYSGSAALAYRKIGNMVSLQGIVTPTSNIPGSASTYTITTLPSGYRPSRGGRSFLMQGSSRAVWLLSIGTDGTVSFSRYRTEAGYVDAPANSGAWLPIDVTFTI